MVLKLFKISLVHKQLQQSIADVIVLINDFKYTHFP